MGRRRRSRLDGDLLMVDEDYGFPVSPRERGGGREPGVDEAWFTFGYEYEVLYPGVRRLRGFDDRSVWVAERDEKWFVIEDFGTHADYNDIGFNDVFHEQVRIIEFASADDRRTYLRRRGYDDGSVGSRAKQSRT